MLLPNRSGSSDSYGFGYQGSMKDDEVKGEGNEYATFYRQLDPRIGRWTSTDPLEKLMPWQSPYSSMDNNPVRFNDPRGDAVAVADCIVIGGLVVEGLLYAATIYAIWEVSQSPAVQTATHDAVDSMTNATAGAIHSIRESFPDSSGDDGAEAFRSGVPLSTPVLEVQETWGANRELTGLGENETFDLPLDSGVPSIETIPVFENKDFGANILSISEDQASVWGKVINTGLDIEAGTVDFEKLKSLIPAGTENTFVPSATITEGEKYRFEVDGVKVELKWHSADLAAPEGSNSSQVPTAQIKVGNRLLESSGSTSRKPNNETHIPIK